MTLCCGIDLHSTNNFISVLNENGKPLFEKRMPMTWNVSCWP
jgi:hypothetical protein